MKSYRIDITPRPSPRPRLGKHGTYNEPWYTKYLKDVRLLLRLKKIPKDEYSELRAYFYLPYPKSTAKKNLINGAPHCKKPDADNILKGFCDALEKEGIIENDSRLYKKDIEKRYTTEKTGCIIFSLDVVKDLGVAEVASSEDKEEETNCWVCTPNLTQKEMREAGTCDDCFEKGFQLIKPQK